MIHGRNVITVLAVLLLPVAAAAAPAGKVVIAQGVDPTTLDIMNQQESPASIIAAHIFETLWERDPNLKIIPALATEMPKLVAPTTWEVKLRKGVKFQNGEDFNAESAMYPSQAYAGKQPADISRQPIGTGPYTFVRWAKDEEVVLEANTAWWRGEPKVKTVVFRPIPDDAVRVAALQNGEIDVAVNIPPHLANPIANHPRLFLTTAPSIRTIQLMFQTHNFDEKTHQVTGVYEGATKDKRVRQAIQYALDVDEIIKGVLDGKAMRMATLLTPMHFGFHRALKPIKQDVAKVKKLLTEAGYPNGLELTLNGPQGRYVRDKEVAEASAGQLTKAGIRTTVKTFEFVNYLNNMTYKHKGGPVWLIGWGTPTIDAETVYNPLFRTGSQLGTYSNPDLDGLVEAAQKEMDEKKRLALFHQINKLWVEDAAAAPLYQQLDLYGASKRITWKARSDERIKATEMTIK